MSLRARLLLVTLALVAVALTAAGWATHLALKSFLLDRVDRELVDLRAPAVFAVGDNRPGPSGLPANAIVRVYTPGGGVYKFDNRYQGSSEPYATPDVIRSGFSTVDLPGAPGEYRLLSTTQTGADGDGDFHPGALPAGSTLVIGVPLDEVNATLGRLLKIELAVGAATLSGLALLALWLVRVGLRPLERIGETADAIAGGDLSRRVADENPRTEIGRLGRTLNGMLGRIEESFEERRRNEERLRRFVADASHELQTPLTSVRGYAELFRRGAAQRPDDLATTMRRIEAEATRMGVLVDDLLLLARLDQGRPMDDERLDLTALVGDLVADARVVEPERPFTEESSGPVWVRGDDARLRQVVGNLLSNARAHTPADAPVTVRTLSRDGEAVIEVADRGPGLVPEHAARVFERFFRADPSRARASGGSGLGLSIVSSIAEAHGGRAEVESVPGRGATFRVVLPLAGPALTPDPQGSPTPA
jgi:two-component system, OmpR family, sensor kinase